MIHISRFVQPPNPNSAVPPPRRTGNRRTPHGTAADRGSLRIAGAGGQCGSPPSDAVRKRSSRTVPRHRIGSPRAPYRDEAPDTGSPRTVPPKRRGRTHGTSPRRAPETGHCSKRGPRKTNSSRGELHRTAAPEKRGFPKTNAQDEAFPKRAPTPNRLRDEALRDGAIRPHAAIRGSVLPALPSRYAAGKPQPALRPCENALRTACRPKAARELRPNGVGARKVRPPLSRPRRPDGRR